MKKTFRALTTPMLDFMIAHCTALSLAYSRITFRMLKQDERFLALKDVHKGKRCFIVALGPSLTVSDLDLLAEHGEFCFSMNRCYQLFDKTKWRPDCYFITDGRVNNPETQHAIVDMLNSGIQVIYSRRDIRKMPDQAIYYKADYIDFIMENSASEKYREKGRIGKFSTDAGKFVYSAHSCVTSIIQVAYFMGFREICLIGQDCGVSGALKHSNGIKSEKNIHQKDDLNRVLEDFTAMRDEIIKNNIDVSIINCTRGGCLESFERRSLESILGS